MTDKPQNNQIGPQGEPIMDTQWLLNMGTPAEGNFALDDILAEFSGAGPGAPPPEPAPAAPPPEEEVPPPPPPPPGENPPPSSVEPVPEEPPPRRKKKWWSKKQPDQPGPEPVPAEDAHVPEMPVPAAEDLADPAESEDIPADVPEDILAAVDKVLNPELFPDTPSPTPEDSAAGPAPQPPQGEPETAAPEAPEAAEEPAPEEPAAEPEEPEPEPPEEVLEGAEFFEEAPSPPSARAGGTDPGGVQPVSEEAIENLMAHTVDAVKEEQEQQQEQLRKRLEKAAKKAVSRRPFRKESPARRIVPENVEEPPLLEPAVWNKRRCSDILGSLRRAVFVTILMWVPWMLAQFGTAVPFFSDSADNAALCVLIPHALTTIISWPVFRAALEHLRRGVWSVYATAALCTVVTLLDEMTQLLLPGRADAAPLGGLASLLLVFSLWGLVGMHRGMSESLRTISRGEPIRTVDRCGAAVAKGQGVRKGFYTRISIEDSPSQWQRLLLPLLAAASLAFALLSSVGRGLPQNFLWCWSVILCCSSSLVFPLAYSVPFGRLALRLARSGAALAGQYGASVLASVRRLAVVDEDLFPGSTAALGGVNLYGEERNKALSYAATLAVQAGGNLGRIFGAACQGERIALQGIEHFHIHDDGGLSGVIRGETVLVGTPAFMRHKAVRIPNSIPGKTCICLAVDGQLEAAFFMKYNTNDTVEYALRCLRRSGLQITLATRDSNVTPKLLKERFGVAGNVQYPELGERLTLSDPEREAEEPNALMYREGLLQLASLVIGSVRLCQTALVGNLLSIFGSIAGALLGFYLTFTGSYEVLTPVLLATYALLWVAPMLPLVWTVDKL